MDAKTEAPSNQVTLALERTYLAYERTLMAWIRTATSMITFGFTLYKFFDYLHEQGPTKEVQQLFGARTFGLVMMGIGVVTLAIASWQHRLQMNRLRRQYPDAPLSLSLLLAGLIVSLGIFAFFAAIFR